MGSILSAVLGGGNEQQQTTPNDEGDASSPVTQFHSSDRWQLHFNSVKDTSQLMVVDFAASWCGPCKMMEPSVHALSSMFPDVEFAKIDVDELPDVAQQFGVQAMPTLVLLKQGKEIDRVVGANKDELEKKILKHRATPKFAA